MHDLKKMNGFQYFLLAFKKYAQFSGRSTRSEFWYFHLFNLIISIAFMIMALMAAVIDEGIFGKDFLFYYFTIICSYVYSLGAFIPSLALCWRRLHDTDRSGLWYFLSVTIIGFIPLIIWFCEKSDPEPNRFGNMPDTIPAPQNFESKKATRIDQDVLAQIEKLAELRDKNILTEEEFQQKKSEIL